MASYTYLLEAHTLVKSFGAVRALQGVSFQLEAGEVVGLIGDNGAGKSTLIKILSGYVRPDEGGLTFCGRSILLDSPQHSRDLGIETVYQDLALVETMSVMRNFFLGRELKRQYGPFSVLDRKKMLAICQEALEKLGITATDLQSRKIGDLSGGERQAVSIGRALHFGSKVLILDEPTSALSVRETKKVYGYIEHAKNAGLGVILISHNIPEVFAISDRFVLLKQGRLRKNLAKNETSSEQLMNYIAEQIPVSEN